MITHTPLVAGNLPTKNLIALRWPTNYNMHYLTHAQIVLRINCLSTEFSSQKGVKGIPLHFVTDTYEDIDTDSAEPVHRAYCKVKIFRDKVIIITLHMHMYTNTCYAESGKVHCRIEICEFWILGSNPRESVSLIITPLATPIMLRLCQVTEH